MSSKKISAKKWIKILKKQGLNPWRGVDLDGTLAFSNANEKWKPTKGGNIGKPIPKMVKRVKKWLKKGERVKIFTAKYSRIANCEELVQKWLIEEAGLPPLEVTNAKDSECVEIWDDIAVSVKINKGKRKFKKG